MALTLTTVTGTIDMPTGETPASTQVVFTLTGPARVGGSILVPGDTVVNVGPSGTFSVDLQATVGLDVKYRVSVRFRQALAGEGQQTVELGFASVPADGPVTLASLLEF